MFHYKILKPGESVTGERFYLYLNHLAEKSKKPYTVYRRRPLILQRNIDKEPRSSVACQTINNRLWKNFLQPIY